MDVCSPSNHNGHADVAGFIGLVGLRPKRPFVFGAAKHSVQVDARQSGQRSVRITRSRIADACHPLVCRQMSQLSQLPGQPFVAYKGDALYLEDVALTGLAGVHGTPLFVYSKAAMLSALAAYQRGFAGRHAQICYAMKANSSLGILQVFANAGCGFDIVSGGELERVLTAGGNAAKVIFSGVGKTRAEMAQALKAGIGCFNVESEAELDVLSSVALGLGVTAPVSIRVNPNVDPKTHPYISTGLKGNKFGVAHENALRIYQHAASLKGLRVVGIDCHIGSQITTSEP